jgi:uncharacterized protein
MSDEPRNLLIPFRRDKKRDFASGSGADLLRSKVLQALMTAGATPRSSGELPWRVQVRDALRRWVPEAELVSVKVERSEATLELRVRVRESKSGESPGQTAEIAFAVDS